MDIMVAPLRSCFGSAFGLFLEQSSGAVVLIHRYASHPA